MHHGIAGEVHQRLAEGVAIGGGQLLVGNGGVETGRLLQPFPEIGDEPSQQFHGAHGLDRGGGGIGRGRLGRRVTLLELIEGLGDLLVQLSQGLEVGLEHEKVGRFQIGGGAQFFQHVLQPVQMMFVGGEPQNGSLAFQRVGLAEEAMDGFLGGLAAIALLDEAGHAVELPVEVFRKPQPLRGIDLQDLHHQLELFFRCGLLFLEFLGVLKPQRDVLHAHQDLGDL